MAERSKALDWNSSNIFTGVRGFESHSLRHQEVVDLQYSETDLSLKTDGDSNPRTVEQGVRQNRWIDFGRRAASGPKGLRPGRAPQSHSLRHQEVVDLQYSETDLSLKTDGDSSPRTVEQGVPPRRPLA